MISTLLLDYLGDLKVTDTKIGHSFLTLLRKNYKFIITF